MSRDTIHLEIHKTVAKPTDHSVEQLLHAMVRAVLDGSVCHPPSAEVTTARAQSCTQLIRWFHFNDYEGDPELWDTVEVDYEERFETEVDGATVGALMTDDFTVAVEIENEGAGVWAMLYLSLDGSCHVADLSQYL